MSLQGKIALVTGAGDGMGRAEALLLAERGADIAVSDINAEAAEETAAQVRQLGKRALACICDMADDSSVREMVGKASASLGPIQILINNAGFGQRLTTEEVTRDDFNRMYAVHVAGSFFCGQAVLPAMKRARAGKIINISSMWAMSGAPVSPHYCAAKAALLGLTKAWAKEFAPWNIHVNAICPGGVRSGSPKKKYSAEEMREKESQVPLKRYCEPIEIAYAVAYLASGEADFVTGQVLSPNGGQSIT